jgi:hypothetical protein
MACTAPTTLYAHLAVVNGDDAQAGAGNLLKGSVAEVHVELVVAAPALVGVLVARLCVCVRATRCASSSSRHTRALLSAQHHTTASQTGDEATATAAAHSARTQHTQHSRSSRGRCLSRSR